MSNAEQLGANGGVEPDMDDGRFRAETHAQRRNVVAIVVALFVLAMVLIGAAVFGGRAWYVKQQAEIAARKKEKEQEAKADARRNLKAFSRSASDASASDRETSDASPAPVEGTGRAMRGADGASLPVGFGASSPALPIPLRTAPAGEPRPATMPPRTAGTVPAATSGHTSTVPVGATRAPTMLASFDDPLPPVGGKTTKGAESTGSEPAEQRLATYKAQMDALQAQAAAIARGGQNSASPSPSGVDSGTNLGSSVPPLRKGRTVQEYAQLATSRNPATGTPQVAAAALGDRSMLLARGAIIPCVLLTQVHSNVPGAASCQVSENIWSDDGRVLLVGRGSTISGAYQGAMKAGDSRLAIVWSRIKSADGVVVDVESPGADGLGTMGLGGYVDNHWPERIGAALLLSLIDDAVSIEIAARSEGSASRAPTSTANTTKSMAEQVLSSTINIPPTITKARGSRVAVVVQRDLWFDGVYAFSEASRR